MASEFDLIRRYFTRPARHTVLGVGDDCAIFRPSPGAELLVSTDTLVSGTHFYPDADPADLGWKALAVNVSDIAAMGGEPRWALLAASLPAPEEAWIAAFAQGFFACAEAFGIDVIGGDTTRGALSLTPTILGEVPAGQAIRRDGARTGNDIWISGEPGWAALGLAHLQGRISLEPAAAGKALAALHRPQPRVALGQALRGIATAMLDVSDGLAGDLGHILERSGVGACLDAASLPLPSAGQIGPEQARHAVLHGGDDYELLFCAPQSARAQLAALADTLNLPLHPIGRIEVERGLRLREVDGRVLTLAARGYDHFGA